MSEPDEVLGREAEEPDVVLRYDDHADALIDVFLPPGLGPPVRTSPLIVFIHGGFWRQAYGRTHVRPLADALRRRGWVVAVPEYRRTGGLGGWPQTGDDVESALARIPRMLGEVAPGYVDEARPVVVAGHSAGGHLALWAGLRAGPHRVELIVALAPVSDLRYAARVRMGDSAVQTLLGGEPEDRPEAYAAADVVPLLPGGVPVTIIQGTADKQVTVDMNRKLAAPLASSETFAYVELTDVDHFALIDPLSEVFEAVILAALSKA